MSEKNRKVKIELYVEQPKSDSEHSKSQNIEVGKVTDIEWLEDHLLDAFTDDFSANQAKMFCDALHRSAGGHPAKNDREKQQIELLIEVGNWLHYWADRNVDIYSRQYAE